jgi:tRNA threonylcarbamoyladenosine biosynthesis protein TsaB
MPANDPVHERLLDIATRAGGPLLAFDTSGASASICMVAWRPGAVEEKQLPAASLPSESLAEALAAAFDEALLAAEKLRAIVIGLGPGSFTGLRVGLATAKGLALGGDIPIFGTSSLAMLAASYGPGRVAPVVDARRNEVFGALYEIEESGRASAVIDDAAWSPSGFADALSRHAGGRMQLVGNGARTCFGDTLPAGAATTASLAPRAAFGIIHVAGRIERCEHDPIDTLAPSYMKKSEAERELGR